MIYIGIIAYLMFSSLTYTNIFPSEILPYQKFSFEKSYRTKFFF